VTGNRASRDTYFSNGANGPLRLATPTKQLPIWSLGSFNGKPGTRLRVSTAQGTIPEDSGAYGLPLNEDDIL
jgi:hypothetical protein